MQWDGEYEPGLVVHTVPVHGRQNHVRRRDFVKKIQPLLQDQYDLIVGFNKMPGLHVYYAADTCYQAKARKQHSWLYRLTQRYRYSVADEAAVFAPQAKTEILLLSKHQQSEFENFYHTPAKRFHLLPPGIDLDRTAPPDAQTIRAELREALNLNQNDFLLLMVGSGFRTKGLDRILKAYAALPAHLQQRAQVFVLGKDNPLNFKRQAKRLKIADKIHFLGGRDDVPRFLLAADLLLHPAYNENTGTVLLEALTAGLPVLTTDVCGYAEYVDIANAGIVLASPFKQVQLNQALAYMLLSSERQAWQNNALAFAKQADIYSLPDHAVNIIESLR
jgi:UDP-glucose:(heptosyl)LPS alpha-1,3-glucosyltransferase